MIDTVGAKFDGSGCHFRIWAPNAKNIQVVGDFGTYNMSEDRGYWQTYVRGASSGQAYNYKITDRNGNTFTKIDPAARDTVHSNPDPSVNHGIIVDTSFDWAPFNTPAYENFIIYQLHLGSFAGFNDEFNKPIATFRDIESKLGYIRELGFNAIQLLPVQEFLMDRSWGYNPSFYFAMESAYGSPGDLRHLVNEAHKNGLAVIFDVVYNHISSDDNSLWEVDGGADPSGSYLMKCQTPWGNDVLEFWKEEVKDFLYYNAKMYFEEFRADGLRLDSTRRIEGCGGWSFMKHLNDKIKERYPDKYIIAEHLPDDNPIIRDAHFSATWTEAHHEFQMAAAGDNPIINLMKVIDWNSYENRPGSDYPSQWNNIKYLLGSHDDIGDDKNGLAEILDPEHPDQENPYLNEWDKWNRRHRYFVEQFGGRDKWYARAKTRMAWALNVAIPGNPMMFMGSECHMWGYWHDGTDKWGDHRFNWAIAGDGIGMEMRRLVSTANWVRWNNPALRSETLHHVHFDNDNKVLAFKRWVPGGNNVILVVVNISENNFQNYSYGVRTGGQYGQWTQIFCSQDDGFGGWRHAGNEYYEPYTQEDGMIYINLPKWSVVMMKLK